MKSILGPLRLTGAWTPPINYYRCLFFPWQGVECKTQGSLRAPILMLWGDNDMVMYTQLQNTEEKLLY